ncbi:class I glutamine amidotransferase-like protein [Phakopsora pachyrhizi]|uniref:Class I glutamine amidotransferase-like protein n=1 Tax=Phakopsora pachyrhizi TaxID=170000 RepID=A0AAV0ATG8_PHAPC|nr:class I glutamine amidotransferase-like protein [Phakopsora pachyrhizi]CAH7670946.1 class I glutamine amidotransferase-like protein [Phakopsora pachyrhizi]
MKVSTISVDDILDSTEYLDSQVKGEKIPIVILLVPGILAPPVSVYHRSYHHVFANLFQNVLRSNNKHSTKTRIRLISFKVIDEPDEEGEVMVEYPDERLLRSASGLFISGGPCSAYDSVPWLNRLIEFCKHLRENHQDLRLFGICLGHQILARVLGSEVVPNETGGWEIGIRKMDLNVNNRFCKKFLDLRGDGSLYIHQLHKDHVPDLPDSCVSIGSSTVTPIHGFIRFRSELSSLTSISNNNISEGDKSDERTLDDVSILTVQGHPEFTNDLSLKTIDVRQSKGIFTDRLANDARSTLENGIDDGVWFTSQLFKIMKIF